MKLTIHKANTRGHVNHGWLNTYHTFSFASYYNPERIRFGLFRVLNDDTIGGGMGFGTHPHDNMEIITIPLTGALEHKDSMGSIGVIEAGEVQVMSAGRGLTHSEYNHLKDTDCTLLQLWIFPKEKDIEPRYDQRKFDFSNSKNNFHLIVSGEKENKDALWINQNAYLSLGNFDKGVSINYNVHKSGNGVYFFVIEGGLKTGEYEFNRRDGFGMEDVENIELEITEDSTKILAVEVPMR